VNGAQFLLGAQALERHGARLALVCGEQHVGFAELAARVARSAGALAALGVRPGDRVLLLLRDTPEAAAAWLGILHAGAVAISLNTRLSEDDYRFILSDSGARLAIVEDRFVAARPDLAAELARDRRMVVAGEGDAQGAPAWRAALTRATPAPAPYAAAPEDPAFWLYSSGTTGPPKGIVHGHRSVTPVGEAFHLLQLRPGDSVFTTSKLFFAYGLEHALLAPLALGMTSYLYPDWPDAEAAHAIAARYQPTAMFSVPSFYRRLLAELGERMAAFRALRYFVAAGERLPVQVFGEWQRATGREILSLYGMSETFCACIVTPPGSANGERTGAPLRITEVRLLDLEGRPAGPGEPGVLWVRHPALAAGYANRPDATREQFVDGWFCSRDVFALDAEGHYVHQGRSDEFLKISGQWVNPGEIEQVVLADGAAAEAACVPVRDADGFDRMALFVAAREAPEAALDRAGRACERHLPRYKRPKWIRSVEELPRTATGKVQRFKLRELLLHELEQGAAPRGETPRRTLRGEE
jgi:benzoate-CoA ligase